MIEEKSTTAPKYLFKMNENDMKPICQRYETFLTITTSTTLYLVLQTRGDLQLATCFLCTRVRSNDELMFCAAI